MSAAIDSQGVLETLEHADRLLVQQVFKPIANEYRISVPAPGSTEEGAPLLFVRQKRMKIREDIRFRLAPDDDAHLFMIKSKTVFEFRGRHEVLDADGRVIGMLEKSFGKSLLRSHWFVRGSAGEELLQAQETSLAIALLRRFAGMVSDELSMLQWRDGQPVGSYKRVLGKLRDRYVLELGPGLEGVDRRLLVAFAVALDALQDR